MIRKAIDDREPNVCDLPALYLVKSPQADALALGDDCDFAVSKRFRELLEPLPSAKPNGGGDRCRRCAGCWMTP